MTNDPTNPTAPRRSRFIEAIAGAIRGDQPPNSAPSKPPSGSSSELHEQLRKLSAQWLEDAEHMGPATAAEMELRECALTIRSLAANYPAVPAVPVAELQSLNDGWRATWPGAELDKTSAQLNCFCDEIAQLIAKYTATPQLQLPPNPHAVGTYLWAREEHARGNVVRRFSGIGWTTYPNAFVWQQALWTHEDVIAVNWEVAQ